MHDRPPVTVRLHGPLAGLYGAEHLFHIATPREALLALDANYTGFRRDFIAGGEYALIADGDWLPPDVADGDPASAPISRELDIAPVIEGRAFLAVPLLGAIGITGLAAQIIGGLIISALLIGVSMLLSPKPKKKESKDSPKQDSYIFSGPENVTEQGGAVPIAYGRVHCGSVVISAGLEVTEIPVGYSGAPTLAQWRQSDTINPALGVVGDRPIVIESPRPAPIPQPPYARPPIYRPTNA